VGFKNNVTSNNYQYSLQPSTYLTKGETQMRIVCLVSTFIFMSGCQTYYKPPAEGISTATVKLDMSYDNGFALGTARTQEYRFVDGDSYCETPALMAGSLNKNKDGVKVEAEKKLTISSQAVAHTGTATGLNTGSCVNLSSFTPKTGKTYYFAQKTVEGFGCNVEVTEVSTGTAPIDLYLFSQEEMDKITEDCSKK